MRVDAKSIVFADLGKSEMSREYTSGAVDKCEVVRSSVGPVRMGWWIKDVIVIWERVVERRWRGGKERAYIGRTRTVLVVFVGLYPVQT